MLSLKIRGLQSIAFVLLASFGLTVSICLPTLTFADPVKTIKQEEKTLIKEEKVLIEKAVTTLEKKVENKSVEKKIDKKITEKKNDISQKTSSLSETKVTQVESANKSTDKAPNKNKVEKEVTELKTIFKSKTETTKKPDTPKGLKSAKVPNPKPVASEIKTTTVTTNGKALEKIKSDKVKTEKAKADNSKNDKSKTDQAKAEIASVEAFAAMAVEGNSAAATSTQSVARQYYFRNAFLQSPHKNLPENQVSVLSSYMQSYNKTLTRSDARVFSEAIVYFCQFYQVNPKLVAGMIAVESSFRTNAVSSSGAIGLGQLKPDTANWLSVSDPYDPIENIGGMTRYISWLVRKYNGSYDHAVSAYYQGPGTVDRKGITEACLPYLYKVNGALARF